MVNKLPASANDTGDLGSIPGSGRSPGGGNGSPLQYSGKRRGQRSLAGYSPRGRKELDRTEHAPTHVENVDGNFLNIRMVVETLNLLVCFLLRK